MIYYPAAKTGEPSTLSIVRTRQLTLFSLLAYPAGAIAMVADGGAVDARVLDIAGLALIVLAVCASFPVIRSQVQRIIAGDPKTLDEFELGLRQRALGHAYAIFTGLALAAIFYCGVASDAGWWLPRSYDAFNALFWGVFLYAVLLPGALLSSSADGLGLD